ncbi:MAG: hypothetical protein JW751_28170 [Polyangiaceae bacterium]|nr:hypothetical protein [Polyangiaceae bacterium]
MNTHAHAVSLVIGWLGLVGCGPSHGDAGGDAATGGTESGTTGGIGATTTGGVGTAGTGGAGPDIGGAGGAGSSPWGQIQFGTIYHYPVPNSLHTVGSAKFMRDLADGTLDDAGTISITAEPPGFEMTLVRDTTGAYSTSSVSGGLSGGEEVVVSASGGEVPAFTTTVNYPLALLLTQPSPSSDESVISVSRSADLVLTWDRGASGVSFVVQGAGAASFAAPSEDGTLTIAASRLAALPADAELLLLTSARQSVTAGEYDIAVATAGAVMTPDRTRRVSLLVP